MHIVMAGDYPHNPNEISGGVESVILYLTRALQQYPDLNVSVVTLDHKIQKKRTIELDGVKIYYIPYSRIPGMLSNYSNINKIRKKILCLKPDLIHAQVAGHYAIAASQTNLPWVLTLHGIQYLEAALWNNFLCRVYRGWFLKREEFHAIRKAKNLISISPFIHSTFKKNINAKIYNIENPISDAFFKVQKKNNSSEILFIGRMIIRKGVHTLLAAFKKLHYRYPGVRLRLAGGGISSNDSIEYYNELRQFVSRHGLDNAVTFLGEIGEKQVLDEYSRCSIFVLSSVLETAPMVIMQAMAAGKAVVSTDAGGARYLVAHGKSGLIVPPNNEDALSQALYKILKDKITLHKMGVTGNRIAQKRFHAQVVVSKTRAVYYDILGINPTDAMTKKVSVTER